MNGGIEQVTCQKQAKVADFTGMTIAEGFADPNVSNTVTTLEDPNRNNPAFVVRYWSKPGRVAGYAQDAVRASA